MLFHLLYPLHAQFSALNVFKYITFRTFGGSITAVLFCMLLGPSYIQFLKRKQMGQAIRDDGPQSHLSKKGTPTMGGGLILMGITFSTLMWSDLSNPFVWLALFTTIAFGMVGFADDYRKVIRKNPKGLSGREKLFFQTVISLTVALILYKVDAIPTDLKFPFFKDWALQLGLLFIRCDGSCI